MFQLFNCYLASFSRCKQHFHPTLYPLNKLNKTKLAQNGWEKSKSRRVVESITIVNKCIKETENLIFFRSNFISLMNTKSGLFTRGYTTRENQKQNQISSIYPTFSSSLTVNGSWTTFWVSTIITALSAGRTTVLNGLSGVLPDTGPSPSVSVSWLSASSVSSVLPLLL